MYQSNTINMLRICLFGLAKSLVFLHKNSNPNTVLNRIGAGVLQRRQTPISISNCGANIHGDRATFQSIKRYMKKDIKALLSISLAAMNVPSSTPLVVDVDISLDPRENLDDSQSTYFGNSIPSMDGISRLKHFVGMDNYTRFVLLFFSRRSFPTNRRSCSFLWYTCVLPLT